MQANSVFLSRRTWCALAGGLAITVLAACQNTADVTAPPRFSREILVQPSFLKVKAGPSATFDYSPATGASVNVGDFRIDIPANAVCDPATSSYGLGTWNQSCSPATGPITITARTYKNGKNLPYIEFEPALRFSPDADDVLLYVNIKHVAHNPTSNILWCTDAGICMDEALDDPSLALQRSDKKDFLVRRLKHFSGYNITVGRDTVTAGGL